MRNWKFVNCVIQEIDDKTLRIIYPDKTKTDIENSESNRKLLDEGKMPMIVIPENNETTEIKNIRKKIVQQGGSLAIIVTKEAALLGMRRGEEIIVSIKKTDE